MSSTYKSYDIYPETVSHIRQQPQILPLHERAGTYHSCGCEEWDINISLCLFHQGMEYGIELGREQ